MGKATMGKVNIYEYENYRAFLRAWLESCGLTHRQIGNRAGQLDVGFIANLISGKRAFSEELREALTPVMALDEEERHYLDLLVACYEAEKQRERARKAVGVARERCASKPGIKTRNNVKNAEHQQELAERAVAERKEDLRGQRSIAQARFLDEHDLELLNRWGTVAVGELARCPDFCAKPEWIVRRLPGVGDENEVKDSLSVLARTEVVQPDGGGGVRYCGPPIVAIPVNDREKLEGWYREVHERAGQGLSALFHNRWSWEHSSIGAATIALPPSALDRAKALVNRLKFDLLALSHNSDTTPEEVYQMYVIFFPVSVPIGPPT